MECLDNNWSVFLKMYCMNVVCRKFLYIQLGENRNKYDNGWIKKDLFLKQEVLFRLI